MSEPLGEVIGSDSQLLEVECHRLYEAPSFGSFVRADCIGSGVAQFAVVTQLSTGPFESARVVQAHRMPPGELEQRKPHLAALLRTTFRARLVGYGNSEARLAGTPPLPARLHCFVYPATEEEVRGITQSPSFLRALCDTRDVPREDLLVCAMEAARAAWGPQAPVVAWGKYLARLLHRDYVTLEGVLQRLAPAGQQSAVSGQRPAVSSQQSVSNPSSAAGSGRTPDAGPRWESPLPFAGNGHGGKGTLGDRDPFEEG